MTSLISKSVDAYNKFLSTGHPPYVPRIYNFINFLVNSKCWNPIKTYGKENEIKLLTIRLISLHLNGKSLILDDDYVTVVIRLKDKFNFIRVISRPMITEFLTVYDLADIQQKEIIIESFARSYFNDYFLSGELVEEISKLKSFSSIGD